MTQISNYVIPALILLTLLMALIKRKNAYSKFVAGAKEGLNLFLEIFPTFLAMLTAVELLRACGFIQDLSSTIGKGIPHFNFIAEILPQMIFRPISGGASLSLMTNICKTNGPDSLVCITSSTIQGTTETTFYILSLYFTSIGVTKWRHAIKAGLLSDLTGMIAAIFLSIVFFG